MKALLKDEAGAGLALIDRPDPIAGTGRGRRPGAAHRHLRHRPAHRAVGRLGRRRRSSAPLIPGHEFFGEVVEVGARRARRRRRATGCPARGTSSAAPAATAAPAGGTCASAPSSVGVQPRRRVRRVRGRCRPSNVWVHHADIDPDLGAIFDPFGNAVHTALAFPLVGEDVLVTGAGPIGLMAARVARHVGARYVVGHRRQRARGWNWPGGWAPTCASTSRAERIARRAADARHARGLRRRPGDERQPRQRCPR